ncbi:MAG: LytTR family DNA-binding domain-containing protein [Marinoscillum sp.]
MKVLIIEDELPAVQKLKSYLAKYSESITILETLGSVEASVEWLRSSYPQPDLMFVDVQLTDGLSFEIFSQISNPVPIIFTTAFDEFAIDAFRLHSIDYLLKPITFTELSRALKKYEQMTNWSEKDFRGAMSALEKQSYKDRFMVKNGQHIQSVKTAEVALFYADGRTVYLVKNDGRKFIIDFKLEDLDHLLDPKLFFRVNRTYLLSINSVDDVVVYTNSRLKISTAALQNEEIVVSREKVSGFKNWLEGI